MPHCFMRLSISLLGIGCLASSLHATDGDVARQVIRIQNAGENLLQTDAWRPWQLGFEMDDDRWVCDNGTNTQVQRGASQSVVLNQSEAEPIVASVFSRCENVSGSADSDYSLYLDLDFMDGSHLWGQTAAFATGTHDWQKRQVVLFPEKPVRQVSMHLLLRRHSGKAWFRAPMLRELRTPLGAARFDGVPVVVPSEVIEGFQVRDVAANSDFVHLNEAAIGLKLQCQQTAGDGCVFYDVTLSDTRGEDRAITLVYSVPVARDGLRWFHNPRETQTVTANREYMNTSRFARLGATGRLSRYPLGCVGNESTRCCLGD